MTGLICSRYGTVGAAATAAVITLGLVSATPVSASSLAARTEVFAVHLPAAVATEISALVHSAPHAAAVGIEAVATTATSTGDAVTAPSVSTADATAVDDILTSVGRVALTVAGAVLSPIWYLTFPITMGLGSLWGYINPFSRADVVGALFFFASTINLLSWLSFPFRLGEVVFPSNSPAAAATRSAATFSPDIDRSARPGVTDPAAAAGTNEPGTSRPPRQRSTIADSRSAAVVTAPADPTPSTSATLGTTATPELPARSDLMSEATVTTATDDSQDAPAIAPSSRPDRATKATAQTSAGQRDDNSASTRTGRSANE